MPDPTPTRRVTSRLRRLATTALVAVLALTAAPVAAAQAASGSYFYGTAPATSTRGAARAASTAIRPARTPAT